MLAMLCACIPGALADDVSAYLGDVTFNIVVRSLDMQPLAMYSKPSTYAGTVYTLAGKEAFRVVRSAVGYNETTGRGFVYAVTDKGVYGFVRMEDCARTFPLNNDPSVMARTLESTVIYRYPATTFGVAGSCAKGEQVTRIGNYDDTWAYVSYGSIKGYVKRACLKTDDASITGTKKYVRSDVKSAVMYGSMSTSGNVVCTLYADTGVLVMSEGSGWSYCYYVGYTGYIQSNLLTGTSPEGGEVITRPDNPIYPATGNIKLYASASDQSQVLGSFAKGERMQVMSVSGGWAYVTVVSTQQRGYVKYALLTGSASEDGETVIWKYMVVRTGNDGRLNLRARPSTQGKVLGKYTNGTQVAVYSVLGQWAHVKIAGQEGYVMLEFLADETPSGGSGMTSGVNQTMYVQTGNSGRLHLRAKASTGAKSLGLYENGTEVSVAGIVNGWAHVTVYGKMGFMKASMLTKTPPASVMPPQEEETPDTGDTTQKKIMYVQTGNSGRLHLRARASSNGKSLGLYENGTAVTVLWLQNGWAHVEVGGKSGYMKASFLTNNKPAQSPAAPDTPAEDENQDESVSGGTTMYVKTGNDGRLHLRARKSVNGKSLGLYDNGTAVQVHEISGKWAKVTVLGKSGYMMVKFLSATAE